MPEQAVVVADANFGVFSVAYAAVQQDHPVVVRMTVQRAKSLLLQMRLRDGRVVAPHHRTPAASRARYRHSHLTR